MRQRPADGGAAMRRWTYLIVPAVLVIGGGAKGGSAGTDAVPAAALEGTWTGDSRCQVPGSPCRDEKAVYRVETCAG